MSFKIFILIFSLISSVSFADNVAGGDSLARVVPEAKTEIAKLKECAWKFNYSIRYKEHEQNFKDQTKVLLSWPPTAESSSKHMFLDDKGFFFGVRDTNHPRGVLPDGRRLEGKREIAVAIKILKHQITSSAINMKSVIRSSILSRRNSRDGILEEKDVDDIREGLCTCEKYGIAVDEIKKSREKIFAKDAAGLFRVKTPAATRLLRVQDLSCPGFVGV